MKSAVVPEKPSKRVNISIKLGALTTGFLVITALSGIFLIPFYDPSKPLHSLEAIQFQIPWGFWLRALHFYSAQALVVSTLLHCIEHIWLRKKITLTNGVWWRTVILIPFIFLAMLTGFILKGDAESGAALSIFKGVVESIPLVGQNLSIFIIGTTAHNLSTILQHHVATFTLIVWIIAAEHSRLIFSDEKHTLIAFLIGAIGAGFFAVTLGPGLGLSHSTLHGPWYLLGMQGMLINFEPLYCLGFFALLLVSLCSMKYVKGLWKNGLLFLILGEIIVYIFFTIRIFMV